MRQVRARSGREQGEIIMGANCPNCMSQRIERVREDSEWRFNSSFNCLTCGLQFNEGEIIET